jgi:hypothetical protein
MNIMSMPGFTAEDSLYKTSGRYQTFTRAITRAIKSSGGMVNAIYPARAMEEEVIVIVEHWPPDPWTPPSFGGHEGTGPSVPFEGGGGGGGGAGGGAGPKSPTDIGRGPRLATLKRIGFECEGVGVQLEKCHSCLDTPAGRSCICYDCEVKSGGCGEFYDCTSTYGQTG